MVESSNNEQEIIAAPTFAWKAEADNLRHLRKVDTLSKRLAYVLMEPGIHNPENQIRFEDGAAVIEKDFVHLGLPIRNQVNKLEVEWGDSPFILTLRDTDSFGEVLIRLDPANGQATAWSVVVDRTMKGGVSYPSPNPEEQMINRIGRYQFDPVGAGAHSLTLKADEAEISLATDGKETLSFEDPAIAGGCVGIGTWETVRLRSFEQEELISAKEAARREDFVWKMNSFCKGLDAEREADISESNEVTVSDDKLTWRYPETGASLALEAKPGLLTGDLRAGLYGDPRMLTGMFAFPEITDTDGDVYHIAKDAKPSFEADDLHLSIEMPLKSDSGKEGTLSLLAKLTENMVWFWTARVEGIKVDKAALAFGMDKSFEPNWSASGTAGKPAALAYGTATMITDGKEADPSRTGFGLGASDGKSLSPSLICTDSITGHVWKALTGQDTKIEVVAIDATPALVLRSEQQEFRWATMWMPYHKLNLTGYKKRMVHFIRQPEEAYHNYRERPSRYEYPTNEELELYGKNGVKAMVWHHTWTSSNYLERDGFVVNEEEMTRAMNKSHEEGIDVLPYIGIVPGRHPALRYDDLSSRMFYDKNWDLQDFTIYSVAGRYGEFFPYITDYWCSEYGIDGYYTDGGLGALDWGYTGLSEDDFDGMSLEELNDRLYYRVKKVLQRHDAGFGLENWGGSPIHLVGPWYDCRMIGETYQEYTPETYRDGYNPVLTGTPFKMYGMDLKARNRYNVAMAGVCMTDIQICSGNYSWGCWPIQESDWKNLLPFWSILDSIDWDNLLDARPWWAQKLVTGEGFYAGNYTTPERAVFFMANRTEEPITAKATIVLDELPEALRKGRIRLIYPEAGEWSPLGDGTLEVALPRLHDGPVGFEIVP